LKYFIRKLFVKRRENDEEWRNKEDKKTIKDAF
jgi:hypothetical protein